ncbi:MAG TPA: helix-turn-helix transcriptional regulator, partial [Candidatus Dojkabacteria bacterium]|nr:helix-turn-helix transcriptional regulator [Candidatus Dojkabacteria bacterium]
DRHLNPWIVICLVSASPHSSPGNIQFKSTEMKRCYKYDIHNDEWTETPVLKLNNREKEILMLAVQGYTMAQIASKLFISTDTIKFHRKNIFSKLGVKRISEAISTALEQALI